MSVLRRFIEDRKAVEIYVISWLILIILLAKIVVMFNKLLEFIVVAAMPQKYALIKFNVNNID